MSQSPITEPPLPGRWHHGNGVLVSGTIRIARWDCDTNPPVEFRDRMMAWMCDTLNAAVAAWERAAPDELAAEPTTPAEAINAVFRAWDHASNEWADMATNGIQWLRNVADGASTPERALESLREQIKHCRAVTQSAREKEAALASPPPAAQPEPAPDQAAVAPIPSEQQILDAAEVAGLWPNTIRSWLPAFHRYHAALAAADAVQPAPAPTGEVARK